MSTMEGSTIIVNFITLGAEFLWRGGGWDDNMSRAKIMYNFDYVHVDCCCIYTL